jgi:hypothetical protein
MILPPNLCYTIAVDKSGQDIHRKLARLLVTSLLRTNWMGKIVIFRNGEHPILPEGHDAVEEQVIKIDPATAWTEIMAWKYRVHDYLDLTNVGKVLFLDCDCIALRSINHLMMGAWDIFTAPEPGRITEFPFNGYLTDSEMISLQHAPGLNAGVFAIRASRFVEVMTEWERIDSGAQIRPWHGRDQHAWNRLILNNAWRHRHFARGEVQFPYLHRSVYPDYRLASLIHAANRSPVEKLRFLFGMWMDAFGHERFEECTAPPAVTDLSPPRPERRHSTRRVNSSAP